MKRLTVRAFGTRNRVLALAALCALTAGVSLQLSRPAVASVPTTCSNATLSGHYTFAGNGTIVAGTTTLPFALGGGEDYNGSGSVAGTMSQSVNGTIASKVAETGTYSIQPDCTGTATNTVGTTVTHFDLYTDPTGRELRVVETDPGTVLAGSEHRAG